MDWQTLKLAEWLPDQASFENPGATVAKNCYGVSIGYKPIPRLTNYSPATGTSTTDFIRGAVSIKDSTNTAHVYAGDGLKLYELTATGFADISVVGGYSSTVSEHHWNFCQFGPDIVIATNYNNAPQKIIPGSSAVALGGSPPRAKFCAQIRDWVVLAHLNDGSARPNRVQWSAYNNAEIWTRDIALQSDRQDLYEGGFITGLVEVSGAGLILQEEGVHLMQYTGPPVTWSFSRIATGVGTKCVGSVTSYRDQVWWIGESDIWQYSGGQITGIASEKVARTFFDDFDGTYKYRVSAAVDPINSLVAWAYPGAGHIGGQPNKILIYAYNVGKWTILDENVDCLFRFLSLGYTLEGLDAISSSVDALSASLDSDVYKGGNLSFASFNSEKKLATFSGTPYTAEIETAEVRPVAGRHFEIMNLRPLYEGGVGKVRLGTRASQSDSTAWTQLLRPNRSGECNVRSNARFTRARLEMSGDWTYAIGIDAYGRAGGNR